MMFNPMEDKFNDTTHVTELVDMSDEQLLLDYRSSGDPSVFSTLVKRYQHELYNYLRRYLNNATLAEDVFQATFLQIHLKCDQFEEGRKFRPWLYTIAINQAIDAGRRNKRHRAVSLDREHGNGENRDLGSLLDLMENGGPGPVQQLEATERRGWVREAVERLPDSLKNVVYLIYYQELKYREAAEVLSIPVGTVKSRMHSAILKLNEAWSETHTNEVE